MAKWEYLIYGIVTKTASELQNDLDRLGQQGWELVTTQLGGLSNYSSGCIFKREVPAP